ncbi:restriction endonuclease [Mariprofundus sp. NF]|uniref:restriction endonuclease n=1 Tax=Mariprofundus sp. NF TaxID=2608716 RepID=UPI0015A045E7|nr:restriction endonuclease [Mariprofundus sp. NF]
MSNSGKLLEGFVAQIEKILLPQGISVSTNEKVFNDDGVQIAEFDIEIEGKVGSTNLKWLIECRDRPSHGAAPGAWIEQLVGRRDRFGFNKVIAVSTTGFADSATIYAKEAGIELRTVTESHLEDISDWFLPNKMTVTRRGAILKNAVLLVDKDIPDKYRIALEKRLVAVEPSDPILISTETDQHVTVCEAMQIAVNKTGNLYDDLNTDGASKEINLRVIFESDDSHFVVESEVGRIRIAEILFTGDLSVTIEEVPISTINNYENTSHDEHIASSVGFNFNIESLPVEMAFHKINETGEMHISLGASKEIN